MRARSIKPGFCKNEQLAECSFAARLLFPGLWMLADRKGRLEYRPKRWKGEIFPYDNIDTEALFEELEAQGLVVRYGVDGTTLVWIPHFLDHQNPHKNEQQSVLPPHPDDHSEDQGDSQTQPMYEESTTKVVPCNDHGGCEDQPRHNSIGLTPDSLFSSSRRLEEKTLTTFESLSSPSAEDPEQHRPHGNDVTDDSEDVRAPACPYQDVVELYHASLPEHPRVKVLSDSRRRSIKARWGDIGKRLRAMNQPAGGRERLVWLGKFFVRAAQSPFLTGQVHQRDRPPFLADIDFLLSPRGFIGVIEGKYDKREAA